MYEKDHNHCSLYVDIIELMLHHQIISPPDHITSTFNVFEINYFLCHYFFKHFAITKLKKTTLSIKNSSITVGGMLMSKQYF